MWNDLKQEVKMLRQYSTPLGNIWYVIQVSTDIITLICYRYKEFKLSKMFKLFFTASIVSISVRCPLI